MKTPSLILLFIFSGLVSHGQSLSSHGIIYENDPMPEGYVEGKVYKEDGSVIKGLVLVPKIDGEIRFKYVEGKDYVKFTPNDIIAFTCKGDSFATLSNFSPEIYGITLKRIYKRGFAKVLVNGPVSLFKHYSVQSVGNLQVVIIETYLIGRKEEYFSRLFIMPTSNRADFNWVSADFFRRDVFLSNELKSGKYNFLDLRKIVGRYNESYKAVELERESSEVVIFRLNRGERPQGLNIIANDSIKIFLGPEDLSRLRLNSRINKVCIDRSCVYSRSDSSQIQYVECGFNEKELKPFVQLAAEPYALPYVNKILKKKLKQ